MNIFIREYDQNDSVTYLTKLLNESYGELLKFGLNSIAATQSSEITIKRIKEGVCFLAFLQGEIVGTILFYPPGKSEIKDFYKNKFASHFGQFAVDKKHQNLSIGGKLLDYIENYSKQLQCNEITLDTPETAYHLIKFYSNRGFKIVGTLKWATTNYQSVIMSKILI